MNAGEAKDCIHCKGYIRSRYRDWTTKAARLTIGEMVKECNT